MIILGHDPKILRRQWALLPRREELFPFEVWEEDRWKLLNLLQYYIEKEVNFTQPVVFANNVEWEWGHCVWLNSGWTLCWLVVSSNGYVKDETRKKYRKWSIVIQSNERINRNSLFPQLQPAMYKILHMGEIHSIQPVLSLEINSKQPVLSFGITAVTDVVRL